MEVLRLYADVLGLPFFPNYEGRPSTWESVLLEGDVRLRSVLFLCHRHAALLCFTLHLLLLATSLHASKRVWQRVDSV